ncbi:hypothetical protein ZIOFF_052392 [Zingiber officinale]|uniref:Uncharacterized protein n=1 Tax=Zingiber officinale TaxID=94328 RepID=A0A8J5FUG4_ZINOF|nr:hypothetical protein ZIOFF_052392 [Zingiber officinale]
MCKSAGGRLGIHPSRACAEGMPSRAAVQGCPSPSLTGGRLRKPASVEWAQAIPSRGLAVRWARSKPKFAGGELGTEAGVADVDVGGGFVSSPKLCDFPCFMELPPLGQLPWLRFLEIQGASAVRKVGLSFLAPFLLMPWHFRDSRS